MAETYPPAHKQYEYIEIDVSEKKRLVALLLAFFFGAFGVHRFYVGKTGTGLLMVLLDLTLVGFAITGVWAVIDCVFIALGEFTDSHGYKLLDWE